MLMGNKHADWIVRAQPLKTTQYRRPFSMHNNFHSTKKINKNSLPVIIGKWSFLIFSSNRCPQII